MSGPQNSEKVKLLISKLRKYIKTIVDIDKLLPILDEFYHFLTTESKQLPASKVKNYILKALFEFKLIYAIKANKLTDDNETKTLYKQKLCKIISFYIDVELFSVGIGKDNSEFITNRISSTIDSYNNEQENILKIFRASLQIRKGKQIMKFKDIILALFMKYFYQEARAQPLIIDDVLFLEQLSIYKIWSSLLDSQAHKDELLEMVVNYMVPLNKKILMSQLGITDADNFMNEALKTTSQQVIEKAIINNTEIIDLDPEINDSYVPSNINEILLNDLEHTEEIDTICKPISWLDDLSMETTLKLNEKSVIIEIDDDDIEIIDLSDNDVAIDLNFVRNLSLDDKVVDTENNETIDKAFVNGGNIEKNIQNNNGVGQKNDESFLKSDIPRTYSRKEKSDIAYRSSTDTMEIGTMTDLIAHTKETGMCVENGLSSSEPDLSQRKINNHLASTLQIVKSFACPSPSLPKLFDINAIRIPESVTSKICIMDRKSYIREEETPVHDVAINSTKKVSSYVVKTRENPKINKTNLDDKTLQYEVSSCRNRINGVVKPKKSVRFADEVPTNNTISLVTYGRIVDSLLYRSYVRLERNSQCEKMIRKIILKTFQQSQKSHKKSSKFLEIPAYKNQESIASKIQKSVLKPKTTNNDENQKHLDLYKVKKIELKNTRYSKRCASFNGTMDSNKNQSNVESSSEVSKKIKNRRKSVYESYKDENIAETVVPRVEIKPVSKEHYSFKARHLRGSISKDIEKQVVEEPSNSQQQYDIDNVVDTTSNDDLGTCNKIVYSMKKKDSKFLKMKTSQISSSDDKVFEVDEFQSDKSVENEADSAKETDQNESEMLCYVLSSSTEEIHIEEELSELKKRPDVLVTNSSENSAITVKKLSEECYNSAGALSEEYHESSDEQCEEYHNSTVIQKIVECDTQLREECHASTDLLVHESENQVDQLPEETNKSVHRLSEEFDKSVGQEVNQRTEECDESTKKDSADQVTEVYEFSEKPKYDNDKTKNHQTEKCNKITEQLSDEHDKAVNHQSDKYNESGNQETEELNQPVWQLEEKYTEPAEQITEECNESDGQLEKEYSESVEEIIEEYTEPVKQLEEEYTESVELITEEYNEPAKQLEKEYNESTVYISDDNNKTLNDQTDECTESADQMTKEYSESAEEITEEYNEPVGQLEQEYNESIVYISDDNDKTLNDQTDECTESADQMTKEYNETAGHLEKENTEPVEVITEEYAESDELVTESGELVTEPAVQLEEVYTEPAGQLEEVYTEPDEKISEEYSEPVELITEEYNESVDQLTEVYEETVELITNECAITDKADEVNEESEQVTEDYDKSTDQQESDKSSRQLSNGHEKLVDQKNNVCVITVKNLSKICNKPAYQLSTDCYKSVEQNDSNEFVKSPVYSNVEHLQEETEPDCNKFNNKTKIREKAAAFSVIFNNNNISAFDIRTRANITNEDSDDRNSFSPIQDQTDKANNEARARKRDLTYLIDSLYSNENENSKGEPIDLVTTGSSFDCNQNTLQTPLQTSLRTSLQTVTQSPVQTTIQTSIPPLKKRRKTASPDETLVQNHFSIQTLTSQGHSGIIAPKNRVIPLEESLPFVATAPFPAAFNLIEKLNAEQFYLKNKQQQQLIASQMSFNKAFYRIHEPCKVQEYPNVPNNNFTNGCDGNHVLKSPNYPYYPYPPALMQAQTLNKVNVAATVTRSNHANYPVNSFNPSTELNNYVVAGPSLEYNKRKSNTMVYPIYNRGLKKESQRLTATNTEHLTVPKIDDKTYLKNLATTQTNNFSEKFVPYKRRQTARPRNSKTTRFIDEQPIVSQEMCYPITPITVMENNNARYLQQNQTIVNQKMSYPVESMISITNSSPPQFQQEQPIIDDDISYPSNPMISIANTCTCQLPYYASCSLHPRNFENGVPEYKSPIQEGGVKAKNINDLLPISNQRYGNNSRENLSTESKIDFNMDLCDVAANEEVFDYSNTEFGVDESPGETGEFEEAYINYEASRVNYRKPRTKQPPKPQTRSITQPPTRPARKSVTKSLSKSVTKLTPYHFAMSPSNPPDSTTTSPVQLQSCINKKRGRPKGSKNRVKSDGLYLTLAESVNSSRYF